MNTVVHCHGPSGHVLISTPRGTGYLVDLGDVLDVWLLNGLHVDESGARRIAEALTWWADRHHGDHDETDERYEQAVQLALDMEVGA